MMWCAVVAMLLLLLPQVSKLEVEAEQLQSNLMQSQQTIKALERRLAGAEAELIDQQQRVCCWQSHLSTTVSPVESHSAISTDQRHVIINV